MLCIGALGVVEDVLDLGYIFEARSEREQRLLDVVALLWIIAVIELVSGHFHRGQLLWRHQG